MDPTIPSVSSPDPKSQNDDTSSFGLGSSSLPPSAMTYDDIFPGLPETAIGTRTDCTIGKWNNKLRVGSRNVTQVIMITLILYHSFPYVYWSINTLFF